MGSAFLAMSVRSMKSFSEVDAQIDAQSMCTFAINTYIQRQTANFNKDVVAFVDKSVGEYEVLERLKSSDENNVNWVSSLAHRFNNNVKMAAALEPLLFNFYEKRKVWRDCVLDVKQKDRWGRMLQQKLLKPGIKLRNAHRELREAEFEYNKIDNCYEASVSALVANLNRYVNGNFPNLRPEFETSYRVPEKGSTREEISSNDSTEAGPPSNDSSEEEDPQYIKIQESHSNFANISRKKQNKLERIPEDQSDKSCK